MIDNFNRSAEIPDFSRFCRDSATAEQVRDECAKIIPTSVGKLSQENFPTFYPEKFRRNFRDFILEIAKAISKGESGVARETSGFSPRRFIGLLFFVILVCSVSLNFNTTSANDEPDQKILGFSLSNFGENNQKTWDVAGDQLEVFGNIIQLSNIKANLYGKQENMVLTADSGSFDRSEGKLHLQDNVVITSDTGAKMMTDTLDWLQKNQIVQTKDRVNIYKNNVTAEGVGAVGKTDLKQVSLNKDVEVNINDDSQGKMKQTTITCDGPLNIDYQKQEAVFNNNVKAYDGESELYADKMTGYFDKDTKKIVKIIAEGNVKIVRGQDTSYSDKATYDAQSQKITLEGRPKLIFYSEEGMKGMQ